MSDAQNELFPEAPGENPHILLHEGGPAEIKVKSDSNPLHTYVVNTKLLTCTCPAFKHGHHLCKHILRAVGKVPMLGDQATQQKIKWVHPAKGREVAIAAYEKFSRTRLSHRHILRDFLLSTEAMVVGLSTHVVDDPSMVIKAGKQLCSQLLDPIYEKWGAYAITFGYQSRKVIDAYCGPRVKPHSSDPHQWDRGTFGDDVYARVDILPYVVEDGQVSRKDFGRWLMMNLDVDLVMQWWHSNVYCLTISPKPRRVWLEWFPKGEGSGGSNNRVYWGVRYWTELWPHLPQDKRPKFGPSYTQGALRWT